MLHLHEPMTPAICVSALAVARCPIVATWHAAGRLEWMRFGLHFWGGLLDRIDWRIAVSEEARTSAQAWFRGWDFEVIPNGVLIPPEADPDNRENTIVFIGRHDPRKGMPVLLKAWPDIHRRTGARLRLVGADPLAVQLLLARHRIPNDGIDILGFLPQEQLTEELLRAKALAVPVGRAGELRDGAHARVRVRRAGGRVGHPRVQGGHDRRHGRPRSRPATPRAHRGARRAARGRAAPPLVRREGAAGRRRALLVGHDRRAARADLPRTWPREAARCSRTSCAPRGLAAGSRSRSSAASARCSGGTGRTGPTSRTRSPPSSGSGSPPPSASTCSRSSHARLRGTQ